MIYQHDFFNTRSDKVLVRNWGYLRWGLYKEHYDGTGWPNDQAAYDVPNQVFPEGTRCSDIVRGTVVMPNGDLCKSDQNGYYPKECRFKPNAHGQSATASLLFGTKDTHIQSVMINFQLIILSSL